MARYSCGESVMKDLVLDAVNAGTPLRIAGRSTWIDAGRPVNAERIASLAAHSGVVDYKPGDLTITVKSGTTLGELEQITAENNQWLPLDPYGSRDGTIGATIATGSFGPLAHAFGRARDLVLGLEFVTGDGKVARGGGKVVKNVAGFDLVRLMTGSWGTLSVITEATLRLYSLPTHPITVSLGASDSATALAQRINSIFAAPGIPFAVELIDPNAAALIGLSNKQQVLVKLGGNASAVAAQRTAMEALGGARQVESNAWDRLRTIEEQVGAPGHSPIVMRISTLPQNLPQVWSAIRSEADSIAMHATPSLGIIRCVLAAATDMSLVERIITAARDATIIFERLPHDAWGRFSPTVTGDKLSQRIKKAFDPANVLNPGILGPVS
jgi:glycolate oxidase FAD binding subunit